MSSLSSRKLNLASPFARAWGAISAPGWARLLDREKMINIVLLPVACPEHLQRPLSDTARIFLKGILVLAKGLCGADVRLGAFFRERLLFRELPVASRTLAQTVLGDCALDFRLTLEFFIGQRRSVRPVGLVLLSPSFFLAENPSYRDLVHDAGRNGISVAAAVSSRDVYAAAFTTDYMRKSWDNVVRVSEMITTCVEDLCDFQLPVDGRCVVRPSSPHIENSPAMSGIESPLSLRAHDAPCYVNTALREILSLPALKATGTGGDPSAIGRVIADHRDNSKVPWIFNELLNEIEYRLGTPIPRSFPPDVHLSLTGACNLRCRFCTYSHEIARFDYISPDRVLKLGVLKYIRALRLSSGLGEPTLNPHLRSIINAIVDYYPHVRMNFFTNGVLLNRKDLSFSLIGNGVQWFNVSLNTSEKEKWAQLHGFDGFDRVKRNLIQILREKRKRRSLHPLVCGSMVLTRSNIAELPKMPRLCRELGIDRFTAFPFFGFGYGSNGRFGPEEAYHFGLEEYESLYWAVIEEGRKFKVSLELPQPDRSKEVAFGTETRRVYDFAGIETNEHRLGKLLNALEFSAPSGAHCHFLWRQVGIGSTNKTLGDTPDTHYIYPCLGPLSGLNFSTVAPVRFTGGEQFASSWRNPILTHLREAQHESGLCRVCDFCRAGDTRDPEAFAKMNELVVTLIEKHKLRNPIG